MAKVGHWILIAALAFLVLVVPFVYYRYQYTDGKRLRVVEPGVLYRSGQMSADGFTEAILRYQIRTVINVQEDFPDPNVITNWFNTRTIKESELCRQLGVKYVHLPPDLMARQCLPPARPVAIDRFLEIMDDPTNHPVLLHCRAGLHRTGVLCAVFRMETPSSEHPWYSGWSHVEAIEELKGHGFGEFFCSAADPNVKQYVLTYRPGVRRIKVTGW
jgi:hypothetical protein